MRTLDPEEARGFLAAARDDRLEALYVVALTTGMRQGELFRLRWRDVDLGAGALQVRGSEAGQPKTVKSRRQVQLSAVAVEAIQRHRKGQVTERLVAGSLWRDEDLVFSSVVGSPLHIGNMTMRSFRPLLERAGAPSSAFMT